MELSKLVCSHEYSVILKMHGVPEQSYFKYVDKYLTPRGELLNDGEMIIDCHHIHETRLKCRKRGSEPLFIPAYTASELMEFLPDTIEFNNHTAYLKCTLSLQNSKRIYEIHYTNYLDNVLSAFADTEADARAQMLIQLLSSKLINKNQLKRNEEYEIF